MFKNSNVGLAISDESLKFVELITTSQGIQVGRHGERFIPPGIIESGEIKDPKKLGEIFSALRKKEGLKSVHVSLPIIGMPKNIINGYLSVFKHSNMSVLSFESEAEALARSVIKKGDPETYMIINFGDKHTGLCIISNGIVMFASTLLSSASILSDAIAKHFLYWHKHKGEDGKNHPPIKKIILCGSDANLAGLSEYFSVRMRHPAEMANVWVNIRNTREYIPEINFEQSLSFASALGLALGDLS